MSITYIILRGSYHAGIRNNYLLHPEESVSTSLPSLRNKRKAA